MRTIEARLYSLITNDALRGVLHRLGWRKAFKRSRTVDGACLVTEAWEREGFHLSQILIASENHTDWRGRLPRNVSILSELHGLTKVELLCELLNRSGDTQALEAARLLSELDGVLVGCPEVTVYG